MHKLLNELSALAKEMSKVEHDAMIANQGFNIQGLKRLHRMGSKEYHHKNILIDNYMIDNDMTPDNEPCTVAKYNPSNFKAHMESYLSMMEKWMEKLNNINSQITAKTGITYCYSKDLYDCLYYRLHKYRRALQMFKLSNWDTGVIFWWDKKLHNKLKSKEGDE